MLLAMDIDGTLCCIKERMKNAGDAPDKSDMPAFQAWLDKLQPIEALMRDKVIAELQMLLNSVNLGAIELVYVTGRSDKYLQVTKDWLKQKGFPDAPLHMRKNGDERSAAAVKKDILTFLNEHYRGRIKLAIDDDYDGDVSAVYKELGYLHLKVMG